MNQGLANNPFTWLASLNALLNGLATWALIRGRMQIRRGDRQGHEASMRRALVLSALFLASYLVYHAKVGSVPFPGQGLARTLYLAVLLSHVVLAALVPVLALWTFHLARSEQWDRHRTWARITWPIWVYVSVTGVLIYLAVYHYPS